MKSHYEKDIFRQLTELLDKVDSLEAKHKSDHREIKRLSTLSDGLIKENTALRNELETTKTELNRSLEEVTVLRKENKILRDDNERMKRILNNNSDNSSTPPSRDNKPTKSANKYNDRQRSGKKAGAQPGHAGKNLSKSEVEKKIRNGEFSHKVVEIGKSSSSQKYVTRYKLDLEVNTTAIEYRIYADENGKFNIPGELTADVVYGENIKAMAAFLFSEGIVANDRICTFINSISGDSLKLSEGSVYNFCRTFGAKCESACDKIEQKLLNAHEICTDATPVSTDGKQTYVRNFSTEEYVLYYSSDKKSLEALRKMPVLNQFSGTLTHDHETALFHFGTAHGDCNVHLSRYLKKNTEETGNEWSKKLRDHLLKLNHLRNERIQNGDSCFPEEEIEEFCVQYDAIVSEGRTENLSTRGTVAQKEEKALLNRLQKYKDNFLLFLKDFEVHFSNNISEKDLRIIKGRQKMAGGFRKASGREMYCRIISFIETVKKQELNIYQSIRDLILEKPVLA